jgi:DNA-binding XRE family transcriptional regulator
LSPSNSPSNLPSMQRVDGRRVREKRGSVSQEDLAHRAGLSSSTVRGIEAGRVSAPRWLTLRALADALGVEIEDITHDDEAGVPA